ncbi:MAG TPA: hypothetical protein PK867_12130 [Pirellulales bacterium]|nr:hypothetical protein [Pirellulales bacterium]
MPPKKKKTKRYIDGIFNYCDRWCERCAFTGRCRLYDIEKEAFPDEESRDVDNDAFWESLHGVLQQTKEMLRQSAAEHGIDLDQIELEDNGEWERRRDATWNSELGQMGEDYAEKASEWFEAHETLLNDYQQQLESRLQMELAGDEPEAEAVAVQDAADVIRWYQFQIAVKLMRALNWEVDAEDEDADDDEIREIHALDRDGSAKVALIGIDRSLAAWTVLRQSLADDSDTMLDMLVRLSRLRLAAEKTFPAARVFVRPGFDTGEKP